MRWRGRRASRNVEDVRNRRVIAGGAGLMLARAVTRIWGVKGLAVLALAGLLGWGLGVLDPAFFFGGTQVQQTGYEPDAEEQTLFEFVTVVLADTEDVWTDQFASVGRMYAPPQLVVYRGQYPTACGLGDASAGPFYCPNDENVYIDLGFYDQLERQLGAPGDFAQAYVIAHEVGHHVQNLLGVTQQLAALRGQPDYNQYSVRLELQADYLAGVWAHDNSRYLDHGDIEEAMRAANQIGDDAIQSRTQGRITPHAFTHGTSEQRMRWFERGLQNGTLKGGDTFNVPYAQL